MKGKILLITIAAMLFLTAAAVTKVMNPLNMGISPLMKINERTLTGKRIEISFSYDNLALVASNQYAIWIEDMDGNYVDTLYVTRYTAQEGHRRRANSIPEWVSSSQRGDMRHGEVDAISGATPKPGDYLVDWDFKDSSGNLVTDMQYQYFIEGSVMNDDRVVYSGIIHAGSETWEDCPTPTYSNPKSEYNNMLSTIRVAYYPN